MGSWAAPTRSLSSPLSGSHKTPGPLPSEEAPEADEGSGTLGRQKGLMKAGGQHATLSLAGLMSLHTQEFHCIELSVTHQRDKLPSPPQMQCWKEGVGASPTMSGM